jgi:cell division topological specificity factor
MTMLDFLTRFFRREETSGTQAKERLRLVLLSDRVSLAPETFDAMKLEMLSVVQRYLDIDESGLDVHFENAERRFMLLANIPVVSVKSSEQIEAERRELAVGGNGVRHATGSTVRRRRRRRQRQKTQAPATNGHIEAEDQASDSAMGNGHVADSPPEQS